MTVQVTRQKDYVAITVESGSIMPDLSEAMEIRDELVRLFPPTVKELVGIYRDASENSQ